MDGEIRPWKLVWLRELCSLSEARRLENRLKRQKGGEGFYQMTGLDPGDFGRGGE